MATPQPDTKIIGLLTSLSACLCAELAPGEGDEPPTCLCSPIPGIFPGQTYAGEGEDMAWVRLADTFLSNIPGQQWVGTYDQALGTSLLIEMGVMRCFEWPSDGMFTENELSDLFTRQMQDLGAMRRALACCTTSTWAGKQLVVGNYRPIGPEGNMVGGVMSLSLQL